jgi:RimJ/RimL family protein N-acetyltransferase
MVSGKTRALGETERLFLRTPEEGDLDRIADLWADPGVTAYVGGPRDQGMVVGFFREYAADPEPFARDEGERWWSIVERSSGEFAGLCSLLEKEVAGQTETEIGYYLLPACWGQGYATEAGGLVAAHAFSDLQLVSLVAIIDPDNAGSIAVARKLGMRFEAADKRSDGVVRHVYRLWRAESCRRALYG